jgi:signal transduction histidine kinase
MDAIQLQSLELERRLGMVNELGQNLIASLSMYDILNHFRSFLARMEVPVFFILLYETELENATRLPAHLRLCYERKGHSDYFYGHIGALISLDDFFNIYAGAERSGSTEALTIRHLSTGTEQMGFIAYQAGEWAHSYMCTIAVHLANAIKRVRVLEERSARTQQLEVLVERRTGDLKAINLRLEEEIMRRKAIEADILRVSEYERQRFGLDLHDDICQRLAGIAIYASAVSTRMRVDGAKEADVMDEISSMVDETLQQTRMYAHASFPVELQEIGLDSILRSLCERTAKQTAKPCDYDSDDAVRAVTFSPEQGINIFRIAQEAIQNAVKHAQATRIEVSLRKLGGRIVLRVEDNGKSGYRPPAGPLKSLSGIGLRSMHYRASQIGGNLAFEERPGGGTAVIVSLS